MSDFTEVQFITNECEIWSYFINNLDLSVEREAFPTVVPIPKNVDKFRKTFTEVDRFTTIHDFIVKCQDYATAVTDKIFGDLVSNGIGTKSTCGSIPDGIAVTKRVVVVVSACTHVVIT